MFGAQFAAALPLRLLPVLAPIATEAGGIGEAAIGYLATLGAAGSMVAMLFAGRLVGRFGPAATLQVAMALCLAAALFQTEPVLWCLVIGSVLAGLADGPTSVAGNAALQQAAPPRIRNILFAVKMLGGPLGGAAAGFMLPRIVEAGSWRSGPLSAAAVSLAVLVFLMATSRGWARPLGQGAAPLPSSTLRAQFAQVLALPDARRLIAVGFVLSYAHGVWIIFYVSFLSRDLGLSPAFSGELMALAFGSIILARLVMSALADATGQGEMVFYGICLASGVPWLMLALSTGHTPFALLAANAVLFGATLGGWIGLQHAEIARATPTHLITDASGAAVLAMYLGLMLAGASFAALASWPGGFRVGFFGLCAVAFVVGLAMILRCRRRLQSSVRAREQDRADT